MSDLVEDISAPELPPAKPRLRASTAFVAFVLFMAAQMFFAVLVTVVYLFGMSGGVSSDPKALEAVIQDGMPAIILISFAGGGIGLLIAALIVRPSLKDVSSFGAAWAIGKPKQILLGIAIGIAVVIGYLVFPLFLFVPDENVQGGPMSQMLAQPGFGRIAIIIVGVLLAPPLEELLFRGIILGGLNRSFGVKWGVGITTFVFVIIHVGEAMYYWPSFIGIAMMAGAATWARLKFHSIGPSIAIHFSYNFLALGMSIFFE